MIGPDDMRLGDYLQRIAIARPASAGRDMLRVLHRRHRETFLFENLTIQAGGRISLALCDLQEKFLDRRQGGYCFEHNTLFAAALRELGVASTSLLGRVRRGPPHRWCRTHMVLRVPIGDDVWLADVGFGGMGLFEPIPLAAGTMSTQAGFTYRLRRERELWVLSARDSAVDTDLYEFSEEPQTPGDIEVANHFTSTHPDSVFRKTLTIQRSSGHERTILRNDGLIRYVDGVMTEETVPRARLADLVRAEFGVELPVGPLVFEALAT
jgi:N-hydroxyarylamine O-acetyltransferase